MRDLASSFLGLGNGGTYAALGLALVLVYRASGVINFATGAQALYAGYTYAFLRQGKLFLIIPGLPTTVDLDHEFGMPDALVLTLVISALLGALLYVLVFRPLRYAPPLAKAVASLGVLVVLQGLMSERMGTIPVSVEAIYPSNRWTWQGHVGAVGPGVPGDHRRGPDAGHHRALPVDAVRPRHPRHRGIRDRRVRQRHLARPHRAVELDARGSRRRRGRDPHRAACPRWCRTPTRSSWCPALAAAVVGQFQHLIPTVIAGIGIGMIQAWLIYLSGQHSWMPQSGVGEIVPLVVMLVALLVTSRAVPERGTLLRTHLGRAPRPRSYLMPIVVGFVVGAVALLVTSGSARAAVITTFIFAILALSLVVVTGYAGQVSLAQLALAGAGAFMLSYLSVDWGVPFPIAPLLAATAAAIVGVLVGLPALRLRGLTLGVVTFALAFGIEAIWFRNTDLVDSFGNTVEQPEVFGIDLGVGAGEDFPRLSLRVHVPDRLRRRRVRRRPAAAKLAGLGDARRARQRALGRGHRRQRRVREGPQLRDRVVHRRHRRLPARLPPGHHHLGQLRRARSA